MSAPTPAQTVEAVQMLATFPPESLAEVLRQHGRSLKIHDLVVEISPRGFRIVREGNVAQGILANRHAMIGLVLCISTLADDQHTHAAFWKEVLS